MKAMLLAAGKGERMKPLTETCPKPLLKAGGKALIEYHLINLADSGFSEVVINHAWLGEQIEQYLGDGSRYGIQIIYSAEGEPLETAGGIHKALPLLGNEPFLVISADIWTDFPFYKANEIYLNDNLAHLFMVNNAPHHPLGDYVLEKNLLVPTTAQSRDATCTYSGIGVYSPEMFKDITTDYQPMRPILDQAVTARRVSGEIYQQHWMDIGTVERLEELNKLLGS